MSPARRRSLLAAHRRALEVLAGFPDGLTQFTLMIAHRIGMTVIGELTASGYVSAKIECMVDGEQEMVITRIGITPKGRKAIE